MVKALQTSKPMKFGGGGWKVFVQELCKHEKKKIKNKDYKAEYFKKKRITCKTLKILSTIKEKIIKQKSTKSIQTRNSEPLYMMSYK